MGIQDRDYMKRSGDDDRGDSSSQSGAEAALARFLRRHPRFFLYLGIGIGVLVVLALVLSKLSSNSR